MTDRWEFVSSEVEPGRALQYRLSSDGDPVATSRVVQAWQTDDAFTTAFVQCLADAPFRAFRWETPPVTVDTFDRGFEFVLLRSAALERPARSAAFREHFERSDDAVLTFPNLGGDALMVVPAPVGEPDAYPHLAAFVRAGPERQVRELWREVGTAMQGQVSDAPVWLSTAGMGVPWLHVRLDSRPKYYGWAPYRSL